MSFFNSAVNVLQTLVVALGAGLAVWGAINLMEGYGGDNQYCNQNSLFPSGSEDEQADYQDKAFPPEARQGCTE